MNAASSLPPVFFGEEALQHSDLQAYFSTPLLHVCLAHQIPLNTVCLVCTSVEAAKTAASARPDTRRIGLFDAPEDHVRAWIEHGILDVWHPIETAAFQLYQSFQQQSALHTFEVKSEGTHYYLYGLYKNETLLNNFFDHAAIGLALISQEGWFLRINTVFSDLLHYDETALIGRNLFSVVYEQDQKNHQKLMEEALRTANHQSIQNQEMRYKTQSGHIVWVHLTLSFVEKIDGDSNGFILQVQDITIQREMLSALAESQKRLQNALDSTGDGLWEWKIPTGELYFNARWAEMLGYELHELKPHISIWEPLCHPDDIEEAQARLNAHMQGKTPAYEFEHRLKHKKGHFVWVLGRGKVMDRDPEGKALRIVGTNVDISQQKRNTEALKRSEERYTLALEGMSEGLWDWDLKTGSLFLSPRYKAHLGFDNHELPNHLSSIEVLCHPNDFYPVFNALYTHLKTKKLFHEIFRMRHKNGHYRWVEMRGQALWDKSGDPIRMAGSLVDIHDKKMIEEQLLVSEARLRGMAHNFPGVMFQSEFQPSGRGRLTYLSPRVYEIFGVKAEVILDKTDALIEHIHPEDLPHYSESIRSAAKNFEPWHCEGRFIRPDGRMFWWEGIARPIPSSSGRRVYIGVLLDISERKEMDRMKDEFVATVSHELRTPLTAVFGSLRLMGSGVTGTLNAAQTQMIDMANRNAERLLLLINDLLDISKLEAGMMQFHTEPLSAVALLEEALSVNAAYAAGFNVSLKRVVEEEAALAPLKIAVDQGRLIQILTNLMSNASKYAPEGSEVEVKLHQQEDWLCFSITDKGPGISEEFAKRIFQKFSQADSSMTRQKGGVGLGLVITKALVEKMKGQIGFESIPHEATTFYVRFPILKETN